MDQHELGICLALNRLSAIKSVRQFFAVVSRLGNGVFWYGLMLLLPFVYGMPGLYTSAVMAVTGGLGVLLYKLLKNNLVRQRPCIHHQGIHQGTAMLDYYSFPSGHTLHAFSFSMVAINAYPELAVILLPFTLLVALSRVILGLHYPSDVVVGALLGSLLANIAVLGSNTF